jgi:hypothetical protein
MAKTTRDILIQTDRIEEAKRFYGQTLGFARCDDGTGMVGYDTGAFRLYLDPAPAYGPVHEVVVSDFASSKAKLIAAGCKVEHEDPAFPRCYMRDPFGLVFNLAEG